MMNFLEEKSIKIRQKSICHLGLIKECRNARKLKMVNSNSTKVDQACPNKNEIDGNDQLCFGDLITGALAQTKIPEVSNVLKTVK